jgi:hypothetical protein
MSLIHKRKQNDNSRKRRESINPNVYSFYNSRSRADTPMGRKENQPSSGSKARFNWRYVPSIISGMIIAVAFGYLLSLSTDPRIISLAETTPNLLQPSEVYRENGRQYLDQSVFNKTKLTLNTDDFEKSLLEKFPEIEAVTVSLPLIGRRPVVQISPGEPGLLLAGSSGGFVISKEGKSLMKISELPTEQRAGLPVVVDETGVDVAVGNLVLPKSTVRFINQILLLASAENHQFGEITLPARANELHVSSKKDAYYVKFNLLDDAKRQYGAYRAASKHNTESGIVPSEYIDVRVEGRVYQR